MSQEYVSVRLFGRFCMQRAGVKVEGLEAPKLQELIAYLLLHRHRAHSRERLAGLFWSDQPSGQAKRHLRQALWELQAALAPSRNAFPSLLDIDADWVQINTASPFWLDIDIFEKAAAVVSGLPGEMLAADQARGLQLAVDLYQGDLLEACYQDWCLIERERLQDVYLGMLDKLMGYSEWHGEYERGISYGARSLGVDHARELTHQRLIRLHYMAGDRIGALRQYERCLMTLDRELNMPPSSRTTALYYAICADSFPVIDTSLEEWRQANLFSRETLAPSFERLKRAHGLMSTAEETMRAEIESIERLMGPCGS